MRTLAQRLLARVAVGEPDKCWMWTGPVNRLGYGVIGHEGKGIKTHRASWIVHNGPIPEGMHVLHKCDVRACVNPAHLYLGTHQDNMRDRTQRQRGYRAASAAAPFAKLTTKKVFEIRILLAQGWKNVWIARDFGMTKEAISNIRRGATWRGVALLSTDEMRDAARNARAA